jgi:hypothetical protein
MLTSNPPSLSATIAAMSGIATFGSLVFTAAGSYTLSASSSGLTGATSNSFTVSPANASKLVFIAQPSNGVAGTAISPVLVQVQDLYGNIVTGTTSVTLTSVPPAVNGTVTAVNGVATFNNLAFGTSGTYELIALSTGLSGATSISVHDQCGQCLETGLHHAACECSRRHCKSRGGRAGAGC